MPKRMLEQNAGIKALKNGWRWKAFLLCLAVIALIPSMPFFYHTPNTDSSIFIYIGDKIRAGSLPFRDAYDHKPPLIFYLNALGLTLGNGSRWGIWGVEWLSLSAASLLGVAFLRRYFGLLPALTAMAAMLLNLVTVLERGNLTEEYALPYQFGALLLLSLVDKNEKTGWYCLGIGVMLGMASTLKQPLAGTGIAIATALFLMGILRQNGKFVGYSLILVGLGGLTVWLIWFAYFALVGIFPEFWEAAFQYNFALSQIPSDRRLNALANAAALLREKSAFFTAAMLVWFALPVYLVLYESQDLRLLVTSWGAKAGWKTGQWFAFWQHRPFLQSRGWLLPIVVAFIDFLVAFLLSSLSGNNFSHYFIMLLPSATILIAFLVASLEEVFQRAAAFKMERVWPVLLLLPVFGSGIFHTWLEFGPRGDRQVEQMAAYVAEHTRPGDYVLQWGMVPSVNWLAARDAPTRYFFMDPFFVEGYSGRKQTEVLLRDLQANPPILIIDQRLFRLPLVTVPGDETCEKVKDQDFYNEILKERALRHPGIPIPQRPEGIDEVYFWICQNYENLGPFGELGWNVFRLKGK